MLDEQTIATLNAMKLLGMARGLEERLNTPAHAELSHAEFVGLLAQDEKLYRDNQRQTCAQECQAPPGRISGGHRFSSSTRFEQTGDAGAFQHSLD